MSNLGSALKGVSAGVSVTTGYNAHGGYVMWWDGATKILQVCTRKLTSTADNTTVTYPIAFDSLDDLSVVSATADDNESVAQTSVGTTTFAQQVHNSSGSGVTSSVSYTATWVKGA